MFGLRKLFGPAPVRRSLARRTTTARPGLEPLEDRLIPSVSPVGATFDVGPPALAGQYGDSNCTVARAANGNFAVVWQDGSGIKVHLFNRAGAALHSIVRVPGTTAASDWSATVGMSNNGTFVVAWTHAYSSTDTDVYAQRFDALGNVKGGTIYVATSGQGEYEPSVAMDGNGNFVVAYTYVYNSTDTDVYARRYNAAGATQGGAIAVATSGQYEFQPAVAMNGAGSFVVAYTTSSSSTVDDVYVARFAAGGSYLGTTGVATSTSWEWQPSVAMDAAGRFVVAYTFEASSTDDDVYARRFDALGNLQQTIYVATSGHNESEPCVAMNAAGTFAVAYTYEFGPTDADVYAECYSSSGAHLGSAWVAGTTDQNYECLPSVALDKTGKLVLVWTNDNGKSGGSGVFAQQVLIT